MHWGEYSVMKTRLKRLDINIPEREQTDLGTAEVILSGMKRRDQTMVDRRLTLYIAVTKPPLLNYSTHAYIHTYS